MRFMIVEIAGSLMAASALASVAVDSMDDKIRAYCALGATCGSLVYFLRNKVYQQNDYAATLLWNVLIGIGLTPILCQKLLPLVRFDPGFNSCVAFSLLVAMGIPWFLDDLCPVFGKKLKAFVGKLSIRDLIARVGGFSDRGKDDDGSEHGGKRRT